MKNNEKESEVLSSYNPVRSSQLLINFDQLLRLAAVEPTKTITSTIAEQPEVFSSRKSHQSENVALTQLAADILSILAQGEKSAENIRKVLFELPKFNAHQLFTEIRNGSRSFLNVSRNLQAKGDLSEYTIEQSHGLDEQAIFCFFKVKLQHNTLKSELSERQCAFLINLMSDTNQTSTSYEQFLDFVIPRTKKRITKKLILKIKQQPPQVSEHMKCNYDAICSLARLFECEVQIMKKIQKQVSRFYTKRMSSHKELDLQIAQLFQALDMRNAGKLSRTQIRGVLSNFQRPGVNGVPSAIPCTTVLAGKNSNTHFVAESDLNAIMRRTDADGDEQLSFQDFFSSLLPYFVYGDFRTKPHQVEITEKENKSRQLAVNKHRTNVNKGLKSTEKRLIKSASAVHRRKPPHGQPNFWEKNKAFINPKLLDHEMMNHTQPTILTEQEEFLSLRNSQDLRGKLAQAQVSPINFNGTMKLNPSNRGARSGEFSLKKGIKGGTRNQSSTKKDFINARSQLFSEDRPELYFHKAPGVGKNLPDLSGYQKAELQLLQHSPHAQTPKSGRKINTPNAKKNELYLAPLMKFFQDSIDLERTLEIDRQECVLQQDYEIYSLFKAMVGPGSSCLNLIDFNQMLIRHFGIDIGYEALKTAIRRQFPIDGSVQVDKLLYTEFMDLVKPRNKEFAEYVNKKLHDCKLGYESYQMGLGLSDSTRLKFAKLFQDLSTYENELEIQRMHKIPQVNIRELFKHIDRDMKGFATLQDYYCFFASSYCEALPVSTEEIQYLFKRHDKQRQGRITEQDLLSELMPLTQLLPADMPVEI